MRLTILQNAFFSAFAVILLVLMYMQVIRGGHYHEQSVNNHIRLVPYEAPRGLIFDRHGAVLAENRLIYNIGVIPQDVENAKALFGFLSVVLKKDPEAMLERFNHRRHTPFEPVTVAEDVDRRSLIIIEENRFQYPGVVVQHSFKRLYPFGQAGAHALGYVSKIDSLQADVMQAYGYSTLSQVGKTGIEQYYESVLQGTAGGRQIEVNSRGHEVRLMSTKESVKGKDITLSLDQRLQSAAAELLGEKRGSVVVMDLSTGELWALVSSPAFDPNVFTDRVLREGVQQYSRDTNFPLINRSISGVFPPGSVFKIPVALAAVERHGIEPDTRFECPGYYMLGQSRFGCTHEHGNPDLLQAIAGSCNVYFYRSGQIVTAAIMGAYGKAFGLTAPTGIDLNGESRGKLVMPSNKRGRWYTGDTLNLSIGQGETLTTPMQLTVLMAAVANHGTRLRPRIIKAVDGKPVPLPNFKKLPRVRLREDTWDVVEKGMEMVVNDPGGTAYMLHDVMDVQTWGKTGTAQAGQGENHAWFSGYVRSSKNQFAFCVFLEHGESSVNAVALTRDLFLRMQAIEVL